MNKVALITGAARPRIGKAIAIEAARRSYNVVIHYHTSPGEAEATCLEVKSMGVDSIAISADVSDEKEVKRLVGETMKSFGRIDLLATCASVYYPKKLKKLTSEEFTNYWKVDVLGSFLCAREAGLSMLEQESGGCVVFFGDSSFEAPRADYTGYFAAKGAIPTLAKCLALELGERNPKVRVNAILPGAVLPPSSPRGQSENHKGSSGTASRRGHVADVVNAVFFLAENDRITGTSIPVGGTPKPPTV